MCDLKLEISKFQEISNVSIHTDLNFELNFCYSTIKKKITCIENNLWFIDFDNFVICYREKDFQFTKRKNNYTENTRFFANLEKKNNLNLNF